MNERTRNIFTYLWGEIKAHPLTTLITAFNVAVLAINAYSLSFLDYNTTRQQTYANRDTISQLSEIVTSDNNRLSILEQIAKDNTIANANFSSELSTLNNNFTQYLERNK